MHYGDNGILKGAEYAVDKYQNKADQEQNELAKIDDYIQNGRATETINMCEPILLTTASLPSSSSSTRPAGTYLASSSSYTKTDTADLPKYLEYIEGTGWKVKKSGLYNFISDGGHTWTSGARK